MPIRWKKEAADDLERLLAYVASRSEVAASHVSQRIEATTRSISKFPHAARVDRETGVHEAVVRGIPLLITYNVLDTFIEIIAIFHTSRNPGTKRSRK